MMAILIKSKVHTVIFSIILIVLENFGLGTINVAAQQQQLQQQQQQQQQLQQQQLQQQQLQQSKGKLNMLNDIL